MEPFSVAAAAITLCPVIYATAKGLEKCFNNIRYARREIESLTKETIIFVRLIEDLADAIPTEQSKSRTKGPIRILFEYSNNLAEDINALLKRVQALISDPKYRYSATEVATAYARWFFSISTVKCIRAMLSVARESINGLLNIKNIMKIDEEIQMLKAVIARADKYEIQEIAQKLGMTPKQRANILEMQKRSRRVRRHETEESIQRARDDVLQCQKKMKNDTFKPSNNQTHQLTEAMKEYANDFLPIAESGRRSRILNPIDLSSITTSRSDSLISSAYSNIRSSSVTSYSTNNLPAVDRNEAPQPPAFQTKVYLSTGSVSRPDGNESRCRKCGSHCSCARKLQTSTTSEDIPAHENIRSKAAIGVQTTIGPKPINEVEPNRAANSTDFHPRPLEIQNNNERQIADTNTKQQDQSPDQAPSVQRVPTFHVEIHSGTEEEDDDTDSAYTRGEDEPPNKGPSIWRSLHPTDRTEPPNWHKRHLRDESP